MSATPTHVIIMISNLMGFQTFLVVVMAAATPAQNATMSPPQEQATHAAHAPAVTKETVLSVCRFPGRFHFHVCMTNFKDSCTNIISQ